MRGFQAASFILSDRTETILKKFSASYTNSTLNQEENMLKYKYELQ